jgi:hypothetical protein
VTSASFRTGDLDKEMEENEADSSPVDESVHVSDQSGTPSHRLDQAGDGTEPDMDNVNTPLSARYAPPPLTEAEGQQPFTPAWDLRAGQSLDRVDLAWQFMEGSRVPAECNYGRLMSTTDLSNDYFLSMVT